MALFDKKKRVITVGGQKIELQPKPSKNPFTGIFGKKTAPIPPQAQTPAPASAASPPPTSSYPSSVNPQSKPLPIPRPGLFSRPKPAQPAFSVPKLEVPQAPKPQTQTSAATAKPQQKKPSPFASLMKPTKQKPKPEEDLERRIRVGIPEQHIEQVGKPRIERPELAGGAVPSAAATVTGKPSPLRTYLDKQAAKQKGLDAAVQNMRIAPTTYDFVLRMFLAAVMVAAIVAITVFLLLTTIGLSSVEGVLIGVIMGYAVYQGAFKVFLNYPTAKKVSSGKNVERDILFAARDLIISLRSGMPLFNAITLISKGYGDASAEFEKVVDKVQLGAPLEEAIDETVAQSKSPSFRRIMLQASVSIKAGADVVSALQSVIDQLSQERVIELRAYGQKLNAIAMFYMLFGVIMPSMGIAVVTILTTFIALFSVDTTVLSAVIVGIIFLQIVFLKLITASRPVFAM